MSMMNRSSDFDHFFVRSADSQDLEAILRIYNEGIADRIATLETEIKDLFYMQHWFKDHKGRYGVLIAEHENEIVGWASLNRYSQRCAYDGVAELSVYVSRDYRGKGVGSFLLPALEQLARKEDFYKIVLFTFPFNTAGRRLYQKFGYREVGTFEKQGILEGQPIDVTIMEKLLS